MFYVAVCAFLVGVGIATIFTIHQAVIVWLTFLAFIVALLFTRNKHAEQKVFFIATILALVFVAFGLLRTETHKDQFVTSIFDTQIGEKVMFSGVIVREPDERERNTHLYVETYGETVLVSVDRHHNISYGDEVLVSGEVKVPEAFETDLGRTFNYPGYLLARDVTHTVSFADITVLSEGNGNPVLTLLLNTKHWLMRNIESVIEEPQAGLAEGLLLGVKQALGDDIELAFRQSGIIHIVVLSGYNVMLVVAFFMFFLAPLPRKLRMLLGVLAIAGFALLVGLSATVVRASIMASLFLFADAFSKSYSVMRMLFFAGAVMVFLNPYLLLYDIGFQLSFMATLGLILITPHFEKQMVGGVIPGMKEYVLATVATQIAVLPLLLYHIGEVSLVAVIVNVLVLPVVPLAMLGAFTTGVLASANFFVATLIAYPTSVVLSYIILAAVWFSSLPFATFTLTEFHPIWLPLMYGAIGFLVWYFFYREPVEEDLLADWEIVEEAESKGATVSAAPEDEVPFFFR